jgi:hypothetical protein
MSAGAKPSPAQALRRLGASRLSFGQLELATLLLLWAFLRLAALFLVPHLSCLAAWLVNYRAGLVRDGLAGSLLVPWAAWAGQAPVDAVVLAQILCALALILACILLLRRPRPAPMLLALALLSPAGLLFQVESPERGGKELVLLAWAGLLAWRGSRGKPAPAAWALSLAFLLLTALQQELFFSAPAVLLLLRLLHPALSWRRRQLAWMLAPSALLWALLALAPCGPGRLLSIISAFHGNPKAWGPAMGPELGMSLGQAFHFASADLAPAKIILTLAGTALACAPLALYLAAADHGRGLLVDLVSGPAGKALALLAAAFQLALLALNPSWGRWLSLDILLAVLGLLAASPRLSSAPAPGEARSSPWLFFLLLMALNLFTWQMDSRFRSLSLSAQPEFLKLLEPPMLDSSQTLH